MLKIAGGCAITAPMVAFTFILLAINYSPRFSWTENALSDLGVQEGVTAILFNSGLIIAGILALIFAAGLFIFLRDMCRWRIVLVGVRRYTEKMLIIGVFTFTLAIVALVAIGIFPENARPTHYYASVAFFSLFPLSMLVMCATFLLMGDVKMGLFTFLVAIVAAVTWITYFSTQFVPGDAIPETISALSASAWSIVLGFKMLKRDSHSND